MRILHVIPFFTPEMGGSATVAYQMARHLGERGHDVTVVASDYGAGKSAFPPGPFEVVLLPVIARWGFYLTPGLSRWASRNLDRFDVIHMHTVRTYQNAVVSRLAARRGIPYVLSAHGTLPVMVQRQSAKRAYDLLAGRRLLAGASRLVAVSEVEAEQYRAAGIEDERIRVVYNGLDLDEFAHLPPRGAFRGTIGLSASAPVVLFLGRIHRIKGVDHLIAAFAKLRGALPQAHLVIAGPDGGDLASLQALAARLGLGAEVQFPGPLYGADKLAALVDADVVAAPSAYEIFGLVPFEALMCGTPVVVTEGSASHQLLAQAGAGFAAPHGDNDALAAAMLEVVADPTEAKRRVAEGQVHVRARLDWRTVSADLQGIYGEMPGPGIAAP